MHPHPTHLLDALLHDLAQPGRLHLVPELPELLEGLKLLQQLLRRLGADAGDSRHLYVLGVMYR